MAERILKFGGIGPLSRVEWERGNAEPDSDPRARGGTEVIEGLHMMSAVQQLEPCTSTGMAYFDPAAPVGSLEEAEEAVLSGEFSLSDIMTMTDRFEPTVNHRRSRRKKHPDGGLPADSDADLWHVPTSNYNARSPGVRFEPLARAIDSNDSIDPSGVFGEFRERRNGGEVHGEVWFDDFDVGAIDGDPVRLGIKFRYNYFGDLAFSYQPFAQRTRCKNSVRALDDWEPVMAHNTEPNFRERYDELLRELGLYGDALSQQIRTASELVFEFESDLEPGEADDGVVPVPMSVEDFYELAGMPDPRVCADHARSEAGSGGDYGGAANRVSAWHLHNGATYWLSWHWNGSEGSRAFRTYRRTADDMLINPRQVVGDVVDAYTESVRQRVVREVAGDGASEGDLTDEQIAEVNNRLADHGGVNAAAESVETLGEMVERFEETEQRLDDIAQQIGAGV